jgi:post-segregation antitoxin (ccd killing protein)
MNEEHDESQQEKAPTRSVTFRAPLPLYNELADMARRRGLDLSALLVASLMADLRRLRAEQVRLDLEAAAKAARSAGASEELVALLGALKGSPATMDENVDLWGDAEWEGVGRLADRIAEHLVAILGPAFEASAREAVEKQLEATKEKTPGKGAGKTKA